VHPPLPFIVAVLESSLVLHVEAFLNRPAKIEVCCFDGT
jgi:hypothetical protein